MEVVGVAQFHLTAHFLQVVGRHGPFDGPLGAHIHKNGSLDRPMGAGKYTPPGPPLGLDHFKHKKTPLPALFKMLSPAPLNINPSSCRDLCQGGTSAG